MELNLMHSKKKLELADSVFGCDFNEPLIHQVVTAYLAAGRSGTKAQKTRAEVSGGGAKPWKQKGTGRARAGTIRSPIWRKGGKVFAAQPRCYKQKVNRKMYQGAMRSILSELIRQDRLMVVESFELGEPKTKAFLKKLNDMKIDTSQHLLLVSNEVQENVYLASRNLPYVDVRDASASVADPAAMVRAEKVIITEAAIKEIEGLLS
ncbi:MAG TPA: 50S ribosomal protein L4 [Gammaproteobacteria bacterium]|nr:50S ribosomal protein L4 [Gammaproteobacteria bacterium]